MHYCIICGDAHQKVYDHFKSAHPEFIRNGKYYLIEYKNWFIKLVIDKKKLADLSLDWSQSLNKDLIFDYRKQIEKKALAENKLKTISKDQSLIEYKFEWSSMYFEDGYILFDDFSTKKRFQKIICKKSRNVLNEIKSAYYKEIYKNKLLKFYAYGNIINIHKSNDIISILNTIDNVVDYYNKAQKHAKRATKNIVNNKKIILKGTNFLVTHYKLKYFEFLYQIRNSKRQIIPVQEYINNSLEEALLFFIITNSNKEYLIWENVNQNRATYIFILYEINTISKILNFIRQAKFSKRTFLKSLYINSKFRTELGFYKALNHYDDFESYKSEINNLKFT